MPVVQASPRGQSVAGGPRTIAAPGPASWRAWWHVLLFSLCLTLVGLRDPASLIHPPLFMEDASELFSYFYSNPYLADIVKPHAGYSSLLPNAVAWAAITTLPIQWVPHAFEFFARAFAAFAYSLLYSPVFRPLIPSDRGRFGVALMLAAMPTATFALTSSLMAVNWNALFVLCLLTLAQPPQRRTTQLAVVVGAALLSATHPLSVLMVMPLLWRALREREVRGYFIALTVACLWYLPWGIEWDNVSGHGRSLLDTITVSLQSLGIRVMAEGVLGNAAVRALNDLLPNAPLIVGVVLLLLVSVLAANRRLVGPGLMVLFLVVALTGTFTLTRGLDATLGHSFRYYYIQKLLIIILAAAVAARLSPPRWSAVLLAGYVLLMNVANNRDYLVAPLLEADRGRKLAAFLEQVARQEKTGQGVYALFPNAFSHDHYVHLLRPPQCDGQRFHEADEIRTVFWLRPDLRAQADLTIVAPFSARNAVFDPTVAPPEDDSVERWRRIVQQALDPVTAARLLRRCRGKVC